LFYVDPGHVNTQQKKVKPETTPPLLMIFESATTQFSLMIYKSTEGCARWRTHASTMEAISFMISKSIEGCVLWRIHVLAVEVVSLMISKSAATQFSLMILSRQRLSFRWWFWVNGGRVHWRIRAFCKTWQKI
jgi:hypothetical protein